MMDDEKRAKRFKVDRLIARVLQEFDDKEN